MLYLPQPTLKAFLGKLLAALATRLASLPQVCQYAKISRNTKTERYH
jgi:hypothetical protein